MFLFSPQPKRRGDIVLSPEKLRPARGTGWAAVLVLVGTTAMVLTAGQVAAQPSTGAMQQGADVILNDGIPRELREVEVEQKLGATLPADLPLIDSLGRRVRLGKYLDGERPLVLTLNYSNCPMLCNVQLNQLAQSLNKVDLKIGEDFQLLSVSIDPKETDQRLRETKSQYVEQVPTHPQADEGWAFTRTSKVAVDRLAEVVGFSYKYNAAAKQYSHPAMLAFVSPDGVITRYSLGVAFPPDDMKLALVEAGQGKVGGVIDQFVLWCSVYDPEANSYVPQAWRLMRLGGAVTIGLMMLALIPYWRGRKGSPASAADDANATVHEGAADRRATEPALPPSRQKPTQLFSS